jgi:hypothetical protein
MLSLAPLTMTSDASATGWRVDLPFAHMVLRRFTRSLDSLGRDLADSPKRPELAATGTSREISNRGASVTGQQFN